MCLVVKAGSKPLIAEKDIRCYKFVESKVHTPKSYYTPYRYADVVIGETYKSALGVLEDYENKIDVGLHSFVKKSDCDALAEHFINRYDNQSVVTCIIPKGSRYYVGDFENRSGFVSDCITYVKIIKTFKKINQYVFRNKK